MYKTRLDLVTRIYVNPRPLGVHEQSKQNLLIQDASSHQISRVHPERLATRLQQDPPAALQTP